MVSALAPPPKVTAVVPVFNAAATITETLLSARSQTYRELEIIVVDDGSTDSSCELVERQAGQDARVRLLRQHNQGVAAARNAGAAAAAGEFLAPLDADDIWFPQKIERQVERFAEDGPDLGLVYGWSATIDAASRVTKRPMPDNSGWVLADMALRNFIGNASSPLIRMSAFREVGGYDPSLRQRGAQGLEDRKLYLLLAEGWRFAVVREFLTGYRLLPGNMSSDVLQMLRSHDAVVSDFLPRHPELAGTFHESRSRLTRYMMRRALKDGRYGHAFSLLRAMAAHDARFTLEAAWTLARDALARKQLRNVP